MRAGSIHEQNTCSFANKTQHRNRLIFLVKHLEMFILTGKFEVLHQYTVVAGGAF
jgi:hypothetical protein